MISSLVDDLLRAAVECEASDLILHSGKPATVRIQGQLTIVEAPPITDHDLDALWKRCNARENDLDYDTSLCTADGIRFRVNLLRQLGSRAAVLRRINDIPELSTLGVPAELICKWASRREGIVIVAGPTGSGKSTTVAAALQWINQTFTRHVVTIEDPVEYVFEAKSSLFTQREVGIDTPSFAEGLRRALRQNPDVIFLGEIRDAPSALAALQASETGHLVFATVHASNSPDVIERLQLLFPSGEREAVRKTLATQLLGILCQRLIAARPEGRTLLCEYFSNEGLSRKMIMEGRTSDLMSSLTHGNSPTACSFSESLLRLVHEGCLTEAAAMEMAENPQDFSRMLRGISSASQATRR